MAMHIPVESVFGLVLGTAEGRTRNARPNDNNYCLCAVFVSNWDFIRGFRRRHVRILVLFSFPFTSTILVLVIRREKVCDHQTLLQRGEKNDECD
jgi:hypothetical protein